MPIRLNVVLHSFEKCGKMFDEMNKILGLGNICLIHLKTLFRKPELCNYQRWKRIGKRGHQTFKFF